MFHISNLGILGIDFLAQLHQMVFKGAEKLIHNEDGSMAVMVYPDRAVGVFLNENFPELFPNFTRNPKASACFSKPESKIGSDTSKFLGQFLGVNINHGYSFKRSLFIKKSEKSVLDVAMLLEGRLKPPQIAGEDYGKDWILRRMYVPIVVAVCHELRHDVQQWNPPGQLRTFENSKLSQTILQNAQISMRGMVTPVDEDMRKQEEDAYITEAMCGVTWMRTRSQPERMAKLAEILVT